MHSNVFVQVLMMEQIYRPNKLHTIFIELEYYDDPKISG